MIRFDRGAGMCLLFSAAWAIATPASAGKLPQPGKMPNETAKELPNEVPQDKQEVLPNDPPKLTPKGIPQNLPSEVLQETPPAQPQPIGWPSTIITANSVDCSREPLANEVIVATGTGFGGHCARLTPGFYPYAGNLVVGNDAISSIKVGSGVRARVFKDPIYSGGWNLYNSGTRSGAIGDFNDKITSMRVEPGNRAVTCDDLREGEIALFEHPRGQGDCVVLTGVGQYPNAESMGIKNDSISSMRNNTALKLQAFWHPNMSLLGAECAPHDKVDSLSTGGLLTTGINDNISSIRMQ